jgi:hypothetical protein
VLNWATSETYTCDAVGNRLSRTETTNAGGSKTTQGVSGYSYDSIYQLTQVVLDGGVSEAYT